MDDAATASYPLQIEWIEAPEVWTLRSSRKATADLSSIAAAVGAPLPDAVGHTSGAAHCLGPGEWLLEGDHAALASRLQERLPEAAVLLVAAGGGFARIDLGGVAAVDLLAIGCSLDLHSQAFPPGRCTRTLVAGVELALLRSGEERFRLYLDLSLGAWFAAWIEEAKSLLCEGAAW